MDTVDGMHHNVIHEDGVGARTASQHQCDLREVSEGQVFVIEKRGNPVAELRPFHLVPPTRQLPNREKLLARFPRINIDSGHVLEEDRS